MRNKTAKFFEKKSIIFVFLTLLVVGIIFWAGWENSPKPLPPKETATHLDDYFSAMEQTGDFFGTVLVSQNGEIIFQKGYGFSDIEGGVKTTLESRYPLASLTKTFVSGAILYLANNSDLSLEDTVSIFFPDLPRADEITIRHLLLHASGLSDPDYLTLENETAITPAGLAEKIFAQPLFFDPGTGSQYSNGGYNVLAAIIEKVSGHSFGQFLEVTFFDLLGMTETENLKRQGGAFGQAKGYLPGPGPAHVVPSPPLNFSLYPGSGSLLSTAGDLNLWLNAVGSKRFFDIFNPAYKWPFGWGKITVLGQNGLEQSGALDGYRAAFQIFPKADLKIIILSNISSDNWGRWAKDTATISLGGEAQPPLTPAPVPLETLAPYLGSYEADGWTLHIREVEGEAWLFFNEFPAGKYLVPQGNGRFALAGAEGSISFEISARDQKAYSITWTFPGGSLKGNRKR